MENLMYLHIVQFPASCSMDVNIIISTCRNKSQCQRSLVNTEVNGAKREVQARYVTVPEGVTIPQYLKNIFIENKTTQKIIRVPEQGEPPYAIIVPQDFQYPMEHTSITKAYGDFLEWAQNANQSKDWYVFDDADQILPSLFKKW